MNELCDAREILQMNECGCDQYTTFTSLLLLILSEVFIETVAILEAGGI